MPGYDPFEQAGDCTFDEERARHVIDFVETCCTHVKGDKFGTPLLLEDWQKAIYANLFGWIRPDGTRRYREAFVFIPRGNAKTTMAGSIVCAVLYLDGEPGAELYSAAAERDQARLCFDVVTGMIRNEPEMESRAQLYKYSVTVGDSSYKALSAEAGSKHGFNVHLLVNDELHAQRTPDLTEVLMTGMGKRRQPLAVHLTTSDYEREGSICNEKYDYACKVRDNGGDQNKPGYDPSFLPVIYEATKDDDWTVPETWAKANPNLGVSVPLDYIERECQRAQEDPVYENTFKRLHLNIRTEAHSRWVTTQSWDDCQQPIKIEEFAGRQCWCGLDLASESDFTAFDIEFQTEDGDLAGFTYYWVPRVAAEKREREHRVPYSVWEAGGWLRYTGGNVTDYDVVRRDINDLIEKHKLDVQEIGIDRLFQGVGLCTQLGEQDGLNVFAHGQGFIGMAIPTKETKRLILSGKLHHDGNPITRWMISNVVVQTDAAGNEKPARNKSTEKIDGVVAKIMAVGRATTGEELSSIYDADDYEMLMI